MAVTNFIPQIWSARLLENLNKSLVYGNIVNRDYEGEIKGQGSQVKINSIGSVTISDYTGTLTDPEELSSAQTTLTIDQAKSFNFKVDDVNAAQANVALMDAGMRQAAYDLGDVVDQYIAGLYVGVASGNTLGDDTTPVVPTKSDAYDYVVDLGVKLDEANVSKLDRFIVVPSWFAALMKKDSRFTTKTDVLTTGLIGTVDGITIYESNNVPNNAGTKYKIVAGTKSAISFAMQVDKIEAYRPEKSFADAMKGLQVYGAKLVRPSGIVVMTANKA